MSQNTNKNNDTAKIINMPTVTQNEFENKSKGYQKLYLLIQLVLASIASFAFANPFELGVVNLLLKEEFNIKFISAIASLSFVVFFIVGTTSYVRGTMNTLKKYGMLAFFSALTAGLNIYLIKIGANVTPSVIMLLVVGISFYMFNLSSDTLKPTGMFTIFMFASIGIGGMYVTDYITLSTVALLSQITLFFILFLGANWAKIRYAMHGVMGTNNDGGKEESSSDVNGAEE